MSDKLNILFICNKSPWPAREGGPIAMNNMITGLAEAGHKIKVLALNTNKYTVNLKDIPENYRKATGIELVYIDLSIKPVQAFYNLFTNKSYHVERFKSPVFEQKLIEILSDNQFDIIQIELLYMSPYLETIRKNSSAKVLLRAHNIEHIIWERIEQTEKNPLKKAYLKHLVRTLKSYELQVLDQYDGIVPITEKDGSFFQLHTSTPIFPVSFGITQSEAPRVQSKQPEHALYHIGAMNWIPNEEGIRWFISEVWPMVQQKLPDLKCYLAGREMPEWLTKLNKKNLEIVGEVPDAREFIESKSISIAPLLSGSGIRIKIIESMAMGKAVISTSIGAEGINYTKGFDIFIADTPAEFAEAIQTLYQNPELADQTGKHARMLISRDHDLKKIINELSGFYHKIL